MHRIGTPRLHPFFVAAIFAAAAASAYSAPPAGKTGGDAFSLMAPPAAKTADNASDKAMVTATVLADRQAIAPGETLNLLVELKMADGVHVYWHNPGGTGLPTQIEWSGPAGFAFGPTQFPAPEAKYDKTLKETSYIHSGAAQFVTQVKAPRELGALDAAKFRAKLSWLSCRKGACVPGGANLELAIPVADASKPADEKTIEAFENAALMLPMTADKAEYVKLSFRTDKKPVKPGESLNAIITAQIAPKHHMQSHKPLEDYLVPALVFVEPVRDGEIGDITYPASHIRNDPMMGKMSEYSGKVEFKIPVTLDAETDNKPRWIRGVFQSQICSDDGTCFPPQQIDFAIPVQIEGGPAPAASPDEFVERVAIATDGDNDSGAADEGDTTAIAADKNDNAEPGESVAATADDGKTWVGRLQDWFISFGYAGVIVLALIGGVILNLMPCVLPVISLKILSYVKQADNDRKRIFALGLSYCAGILVFFGIISVLYYTSGQAWGEHFQNPYVVLILAAIITAFALSLFGVFAVFAPTLVNKLGAKAEESEGLHSAFFTGVLATILGTACTGPFMSAALGAANEFSAIQGAMIFMAVGVGMMLPFLILSANPAWLKFVPKPGKWMGTFEAIMGFILLGTVIWIINPIRTQLGDYGLLLSLMFLLGIGIAVWLRGKAQFTTASGKRWQLNGAAIAMLAVAWLVPFRGFATINQLLLAKEEAEKFEADGRWLARTGNAGGESAVLPTPEYADGAIDWFHYDKDLVERYVNAGFTVFVDFTADWCATCKTNLKSSIDIDSTRNLMRDLKVIPFEADYTRRNPKMKKILQSYGRPGVPLYLVFSPNQPDAPQVLDELLTPGAVADALKKAGPSKPDTKVASASRADAPATTAKPNAH